MIWLAVLLSAPFFMLGVIALFVAAAAIREVVLDDGTSSLTDHRPRLLMLAVALMGLAAAAWWGGSAIFGALT